MRNNTTYTRIERTKIDPETRRLVNEIASATRWLTKVLAEGSFVGPNVDAEVELEMLREHLRQELLRIEESAGAGRLLR